MNTPYEAMVWLGREEADDLRMLQRRLHPGEVFVDCGANIGLWTLAAASSLGPAGQVFAFEPNPQTAARLSRHVEENGLSSIVQVRSCCAGVEAGEVDFHCESHHNLSRIAEPGAATIRVPVVTLDETLAGETVHGLKIDVEGHELAVLMGAEQTIQRCQPWICVEFNTTLSASNRLGDWPVHEHLCRRGYTARLFTDASPNPAVLDAGWRHHCYCNLLYLHD
jgi:FkbM family methyltransferase